LSAWVDVGAVLDEVIDHGDAAALRRPHQGGLALAIDVVGLRLGGQQPVGDGDVTAFGGAHQRRQALDIGALDIGAGDQQTFDDPFMAARRRADQSRPAVAIGMIDVRAGRQQLADPILIATQGGHYEIVHRQIPFDRQSAENATWPANRPSVETPLLGAARMAEQRQPAGKPVKNQTV
jgi:hypothetical protein